MQKYTHMLHLTTLYMNILKQHNYTYAKIQLLNYLFLAKKTKNVFSLLRPPTSLWPAEVFPAQQGYINVIPPEGPGSA